MKFFPSVSVQGQHYLDSIAKNYENLLYNLSHPVHIQVTDRVGKGGKSSVTAPTASLPSRPGTSAQRYSYRSDSAHLRPKQWYSAHRATGKIMKYVNGLKILK